MERVWVDYRPSCSRGTSWGTSIPGIPSMSTWGRPSWSMTKTCESAGYLHDTKVAYLNWLLWLQVWNGQQGRGSSGVQKDRQQSQWGRPGADHVKVRASHTGSYRPQKAGKTYSLAWYCNIACTCMYCDLIHRCNKNGDGQIDYHEFALHLTRQQPPAAAASEQLDQLTSTTMKDFMPPHQQQWAHNYM